MRTDGTLVKIAQVSGIHWLNCFRAACEEGMEISCSGGLPGKDCGQFIKGGGAELMINERLIDPLTGKGVTCWEDVVD